MQTFLIAFFLCLAFHTAAQTGAWTYFTPPPEVNSLVARGNTILAGTFGGGIVRFDTLGNRTHFNTGNSGLPSDSIRQLAIDAEGHWWLQHPGGISRFDGTNAQTWTLTQTGLPAAAVVRSLKAAPDSSLYVATDNGVAVFKSGVWTVLNTANSGLPTNNLWDVAFGPADGKRYFATSGRGVVVQDGANWTSYTSATTGVSLMDNVFSVAVTTEGVLWAIGGNGPTTSLRLVKFETGVWTGFTSASIGIATPTTMRKTVAGEAGRLILTTARTVSVWEQGAWTHYDAEDIGCSLNAAVASLEDGAGRIWAYTACQLARFDGQTWVKPGLGLAGPAGGVMWDGIAEGADGSFWIVTSDVANPEGNITRMKDDTWQYYYPTDFGASQNNVYSVQAAPGGAVWFGLDSSEILRYANGNWTLYDTCAVLFPNHFVLTGATGPDGDQWFSLSPYNPSLSGAGVARLSADGQWQFFNQANSPLPANSYIRKILFDTDGNAWFSTSFHGAYRYNGVVWENFTLLNNTGFDYLALAPDGAVWAAVSGSGIARFDGQEWVFPPDVNSGIPSVVVFRIAFDRAGGLYVGYDPGTPGARVAEWRGGVWTELVPPGWDNSGYDEPDAFFVDSQNRLWFAKSVDPRGGVYRYDPMLVRTVEPATNRPMFSVWPNPSSGLFTLRLEAPLAAEARLHVWNALGQNVYNRIIAQTADTVIPVDLSALLPGVYWLSLAQRERAGATVRVVKR